ncbi:MAG TPA: hypothetical protein VEA80_07855 [Vitreimonas sp.]|uniref:hypothetical protein n=1 Tax=Vitreimonas sp. TaxID=3069702 RepID=UPI002D2FB6F1|nr:hypothetical protein [Vitreimonas sp.]HYD87373.1 hypothetical protein [Vitreimonas sp.]
MPQQRDTGREPDYTRNTRPPPDNPDDIEIDQEQERERQRAGPDDLKRNPGIGASKGATMAGADADDVDDLYAEGENTFPGDVENDSGRPGTGVDPKRRPRENK